MANQNVNQDAQIAELAAQLKAGDDHAAERAVAVLAKLQADLKAASDKHDFQKKRAEKLEAALSDTRTAAKATPISGLGITVLIDGVAQTVIGDFRADNTFGEVKRGHCPEGVTLIAIDKKH